MEIRGRSKSGRKYSSGDDIEYPLIRDKKYKSRELVPTHKTCSKCGQLKRVSEFTGENTECDQCVRLKYVPRMSYPNLDGATHRVCNRCLRELPRDAFYKYSNGKPRSYCIECMSRGNKRRRIIKSDKPGYKICANCGQELPEQSFDMNGRWRRNVCKLCHREQVYESRKRRKRNAS